MSGLEVDEDVWEAVLGPTAHDYFQGHDPCNDSSWPPEGEGPHDGVFWHRAIRARLVAQGATVEAAKALRHTLRRNLQAGELKAVAVHPESGRAYPIPTAAWQATGDTGRVLWWSGLHWSGVEGESPYDVYLIDPEPAVAPKKGPSADIGSRERNNVARLVYGLARVAYAERVDAHGIYEEIAGDLEKLGWGLSADTVSKWIKAGRELYDPQADTTRKPS
ncbi:hypothetical protein [Phenylobacterium sp.]|uniref:hypothetical protein n=1 Tax=Phenylobacterium sp. TaxID=1871053 RepID=UPI0035AF1C83